MTETTAVAVYVGGPNRPVENMETLEAFLTSNVTAIANMIPKTSVAEPGQILASIIRAVADSEVQSKLMGCTQQSVWESVALGVENDLVFGQTMGQAFLVPFAGKCKLMIGYKGWVKLLAEAGVRMDAYVVYEGEVFAPHLGTDQRVVHVPNLDRVRTREADKAIRAVYSVATFGDGRQSIETMNRAEVEQIRAGSKQPNGTAWRQYWGEMAKKTVMLRHRKRLPLISPKVREALSRVEGALDYEHAVYGINAGPNGRVSPAEKAEEDRKAIRGEVAPETIEGEVVQAEAEGVPPSNPPEQADPPALDALRSQITDLCAVLVEKAKEEGKTVTTIRLIETASKQTVGQALTIGKMDAEQLTKVRDRLEKWRKEKERT